VFGWGLGGLGWIESSFEGRSQPVQCLVAFLVSGREPTRLFGWRIGGRAAPFSVWLKEFGVWWESIRLERLRLPDFDGRVQLVSDRNILPWSQPNPPILQTNSHRNGFASIRFAPLSNQTHDKILEWFIIWNGGSRTEGVVCIYMPTASCAFWPVFAWLLDPTSPIRLLAYNDSYLRAVVGSLYTRIRQFI